MSGLVTGTTKPAAQMLHEYRQHIKNHVDVNQARIIQLVQGCEFCQTHLEVCS